MIWAILLAFLILAAVIIMLVMKLASDVNSRLNQMGQIMQDANKIISQNLGHSSSVFANVHEQLGRLESTNQQIVTISKDISSLQELLRAPKLRGQIGETLLENLLSLVLPKQFYTTQYRFKNGDAVDAVIHLGERLVPIDAKFSLENFQKMQDEKDEILKNSFRKKFIQDVKNRVDEIAAKYILPTENTYDFALMYIPAENVYYEVAVNRDELFNYCLSKKVIPVSPNTLYAYMQVICLGLKGLKVEENAKQILKSLSTLDVEIVKFKEEFDILGKHISSTQSKYVDSQKRLDRFQDKLNSIHDTKQIES
ncbi:MAG: DNA recombination protein RmuC [Candidatus Omnitrophota bacterium]|jgi:DNA recombination protein RmuC